MKRQITLQYFDGKKWIHCGKFLTEHQAWISLGGDDLNYRTIDQNGKVITDKSSSRSTGRKDNTL